MPNESVVMSLILVSKQGDNSMQRVVVHLLSFQELNLDDQFEVVRIRNLAA